MSLSAADLSINKPIYVYSLDFDGCCDEFHKGLIQGLPDWLNHFKANGYLPKQIKSTAETASQIILINGSTRQDLYLDSLNRFICCRDSQKHIENGSCFDFLTRLEIILKEVAGEKVILDKFLIPDTQGEGREHGGTFNYAIQQETTNQFYHDELSVLSDLKEKHHNDDKVLKNQCQDEFKITLLYTQIHRLAIQVNENQPIIFNFYDDRKDICENLIAAFKSQPQLLPKNVVLNICQYLPEEQNVAKTPESITTIHGSGLRDANYIENANRFRDELYNNYVLNKQYAKTSDLIDKINKTLDATKNFSTEIMKFQLEKFKFTSSDDTIFAALKSAVEEAAFIYDQQEHDSIPASLDEEENPTPPHVQQALELSQAISKSASLQGATQKLAAELEKQISSSQKASSFRSLLFKTIKQNKELLSYFGVSPDADVAEVSQSIINKK